MASFQFFFWDLFVLKNGDQMGQKFTLPIHEVALCFSQGEQEAFSKTEIKALPKHRAQIRWWDLKSPGDTFVLLLICNTSFLLDSEIWYTLYIGYKNHIWKRQQEGKEKPFWGIFSMLKKKEKKKGQQDIFSLSLSELSKNNKCAQSVNILTPLTRQGFVASHLSFKCHTIYT